MFAGTYQKVYFYLRQPVFWLLLLLLAISGCDSCLERSSRHRRGIELYQPVEGLSSRMQSPVTPLGMPAQTPATPHTVQSPESPDGSPDMPTEYEIVMAKVQQIEAGMSHEEVVEIIGAPGILIAGNSISNGVLQWNLTGVGFMGRFESNSLVRSTLVRNRGVTPNDIRRPGATYTQNLFDSIRLGMSYEDVYKRISTEPDRLTDTDSTVGIYQWRDSRGSSIIGRFEEGVLTRKSGQIKSNQKQSKEPAPVQESAIPDVPYNDPITNAESSDTVSEEMDSIEEFSDIAQEESVNAPSKPQVHIAGESRRERELETSTSPYAGRSYKPVAKLPNYARKIRRGDFEIRVRNRSETTITIAIIYNDNGVDMAINSGGTGSFFVGRGIYTLYYIYNNDPFTLHQGQELPVEVTLADYVVTIYDDFYSVNYLDRNLEPSSISRR